MHLLTLEELRTRLAVSRTTCWRVRSQPDFPRPVRIRGAVRFVTEDVEKWLVSNRDLGAEVFQDAAAQSDIPLPSEGDGARGKGEFSPVTPSNGR